MLACTTQKLVKHGECQQAQACRLCAFAVPGMMICWYT